MEVLPGAGTGIILPGPGERMKNKRKQFVDPYLLHGLPKKNSAVKPG